jgi:ribosomal protein L35
MSKSHKSNRSLLKRIKITGTGKILKRRPGQNHFNAKDSGTAGMHKHGPVGSPQEYHKTFQALLPDEHIAS